MARMIPAAPPLNNPSRAENRLFFRIRDSLSNSWTALHSLGLGNHRTKPWAEADFVLVGPLGVYCVEVKGGRVARQDGLWQFRDRNDDESTKREGPFEQAGGASAALYAFLNERIPEIKTSVVGFGVATPDFTFRITGPDVISDVVYDERDGGNTFDQYVNRIADYWHRRLRGISAQQPLNPKFCERIVEQLRPDFDLEPSLRCRMGIVRDELLRLTNEQYKLVDALGENARVLIRGGAGTGKSLLALREARRIASHEARVLLCCFNRLLAADLRTALCDCPSLTVAHLHGHMAEIVTKAGLKHRLPQAEAADLFEVFYPELCVEALLDAGADQYDALIIDEGQDLMRDAYLDVFDLLLRGGIKGGTWRVFYDPNQNIYKGHQPSAVQAFENGMPAQFRLFTNCRNTLPIATTTSLLTGTPCVETLTVDGPEVKTQWYSSPLQQVRQISNHLNYLLGAGVSPGEVTILSRRKLPNSALGLGLRDVPVDMYDITQGSRDSGHNRRVQFSTIAAFKGLESEAIILADVDDLTSDEARELLYVGTSRARVLLAVFFSETVRDSYKACALRFGEMLSQNANPLDH